MISSSTPQAWKSTGQRCQTSWIVVEGCSNEDIFDSTVQLTIVAIRRTCLQFIPTSLPYLYWTIRLLPIVSFHVSLFRSIKMLSMMSNLTNVRALDNAIPIKSWFCDPQDVCLLNLLPFLDSLRFTSGKLIMLQALLLTITLDVRSILSRNIHKPISKTRIL